MLEEASRQWHRVRREKSTSISFSFPGLGRQGGGARGGGIRGVAGRGADRGRTTPRVTTTTKISPAPSVSGCKLLLYASTYLRGQPVEITGHVTDLASLDFGDKLVSLKVEGGCRWEIFQGESQTSDNLMTKCILYLKCFFRPGLPRSEQDLHQWPVLPWHIKCWSFTEECQVCEKA